MVVKKPKRNADGEYVYDEKGRLVYEDSDEGAAINLIGRANG